MGNIDCAYLHKLKKKYPEFNFCIRVHVYKDYYNFEIEGATKINRNYHLCYAYPHDDIVYRPNFVMEHIERTLIPIAIKETEREKDMPTKSNFEFSSISCESIGNLWIGPTTPSVKKVIFNGPATIVIWSDNSKTVVKVKEEEEFDPWVGIAMCHMKKRYGNKFHSNFTKWAKEYTEQEM